MFSVVSYFSDGHSDPIAHLEAAGKELWRVCVLETTFKAQRTAIGRMSESESS